MFTRKTLRFRLLALLLSLGVFALLSAKAAHAALIPEPLPRINTTFSNDEFYQPEPNEPVLLKGTLYFVLDTEPYGFEIWRTDGTAAGSSLVRDLYPGTGDGVPRDASLVVVGDAFYFVGNDETGTAIWRYDGSEFQKTDLEGDDSTQIWAEIAVGDALYAGADDELWRIVGTTATKLDLKSKGFSSLGGWAVVGEGLYMIAYLAGISPRLIYIEGTTSTVIDFGENTPTMIDLNLYTYPRGWAAVGEGLYFTAILEGIGNRLLYIEGTTPTVIDFGEDTPFINVKQIMVAEDRFYVVTDTYKEGVFEQYALWQIAGTTPTQAEEIASGSSFASLVAVVGDSLYFSEDGDRVNRIWRYDGSTATPIHFKDGNIFAGSVGQVNGALYFFLSNLENDTKELWRVEGTTAAQVAMTATFRFVGDIAVVGDTLYMFLRQWETEELWKTELWKVDGLTSTRLQAYPSVTGDHGYTLRVFGNRLWVKARTRPGFDRSDFADGVGYFEYDGERFTPLNGPFGTSSNPSEYVALGDDLYFSALDGTDVELWHLHENAVVKIDINAGDGSSYPRAPIAVGNAIYLSALDGNNGNHYSLWQVIANTPVKIDLPLYHREFVPFNLAAANGALYVIIYNSPSNELYRVDGVNVTKINIEGDTSVSELTAVGTTLYLVNGSGLWQLKGTTATRITLPDSTQWSLSSLRSKDNTLYLVAASMETTELWQVKDTTITRLPIPNLYYINYIVADSTIYLFTLGNCSSESPAPAMIWRVKGDSVAQVDFETMYCPKYLTSVGDTLYLSGQVNGETELWQVADTHASKIDINPGAESSGPTDLTAMGDTLYLSAFDGTDRELWRVRGLNKFKADVFAGSGSGQVTNIFATPSKLYFSAWGSTSSGAELWTVTEVDSSVFLPGIQK